MSRGIKSETTLPPNILSGYNLIEIADSCVKTRRIRKIGIRKIGIIRVRKRNKKNNFLMQTESHA